MHLQLCCVGITFFYCQWLANEYTQLHLIYFALCLNCVKFSNEQLKVSNSTEMSASTTLFGKIKSKCIYWNQNQQIASDKTQNEEKTRRPNHSMSHGIDIDILHRFFFLSFLYLKSQKIIWFYVFELRECDKWIYFVWLNLNLNAMNTKQCKSLMCHIVLIDHGKAHGYENFMRWKWAICLIVWLSVYWSACLFSWRCKRFRL